MFRIFLLIVIIASAVGNGIVKRVMKDDEPWPNGPVPKFTEYLQCDYRHNFPRDHQWTYAYNIHCTKKEGESDLILSIDYDNNVFDNFVVTSCDPKDVANSVFPPKQKEAYTATEADEKGRHVISYIKYKTAEGKCFARKYQYVNRVATAAKRFTPEEIDCPGKEGWLKYGEVAQFTGCRVPKLPLSNIVKAWVPSGGSLDENKLTREKHLDCTFDQYSQLYRLVCVKGDKENEYIALVNYKSWSNKMRSIDLWDEPLDRFTVTTCKEEDIINGIFPIKDTHANPKDYNWVEKIWFAAVNGDCYKREYPNYEESGPTEDAVKVDCPKFPDQWINPSWGFAGQWRQCKGPMSIREMAQKESQ